MSYPILYESDATDFFNLGLGTLSDAITATVTEERNGEFVLEMAYPVDGRRADLLKNNRIIKVDAGHKLTDQRFVIKTVTPHMDNSGNTIITVYAEHISYVTNDLTLKPKVKINNANGKNALEAWRGAITEKNNITVDSDIDTVTSTEWHINEVQNARQALGGVEGSILDMWHGEYKFDNLHVSLLKNRGTTANTLLAYGRNITNFQQEENITSTYTSIYPYVALDKVNSGDENEQKIYTVDGYIVDSKYVDNYPNRKILPIDFSSEFKNVKVGTKPKDADTDTKYMTEDEVKERLNNRAKSYIRNNNVGVPRVSIKLSFVDLSKTTNYADSTLLEEVDLCDEVPVRFAELGIDTTAKVSRVVWNVLLDSYDTIELGDIQVTLGDKINQIDQKSKQRDNALDKWKNVIQAAADGKSTIFRGPNTPTANHIGDLWYKPNGEDTEMYQWDGVTWQFIFSTKHTKELDDLIAQAQKDTEQAKQRADQANEKADQSIRSASDALDSAHEVNQKVITLQGGSKVTLAELEDGLKLKLSNDDFESYRAQTTQLIQDKVSSSDFESYRSQTDNAILDKVSSKDFESRMSIIDNNINLKVSQKDFDNLEIGGRNLLLKSDVFLKADGSSQRFDTSIDDESRLQGKQVTLSFQIHYDKVVGLVDGQPNRLQANIAYEDDGTTKYLAVMYYPKVGEVIHKTVQDTFTLPNNAKNIRVNVLIQGVLGTAGTVRVGHPMLSEGNKATDWTPAPEDMASKDKLISQINLSPEGILIQGDKVHITGQTSIDNAVIKSAMLDSVSANKMTTGTLNAANVNLINVNANSIVTGTLSGIKIRQESGSQTQEMSNGSIKSYDSGNLTTELGQYGLEFYNGEGDKVGSFEPTVRTSDVDKKGLGITVNSTFFSLGHEVNGERRAAFRTGQSIYDIGGGTKRTVNQTVVSGMYDDRDASNQYAELFLGANAMYSVPNVNTNYSRTQQASILLKNDPSAEGGNSVSMYVGGYGKYDYQYFEVLKNHAGNTAAERILYVSEGSFRAQGAYSTYSTLGTNMIRTNTIGELQRTSSSRRYKLLEEKIPLEKAKKFLEIDVKDWYDKQSCDLTVKRGLRPEDESNIDLRRTPGLIAEDLQDVGLDEFLSFDEEGKPNGINTYTWVLMQPILKEHEKEINELKDEIKKLKGQAA